MAVACGYNHSPAVSEDGFLFFCGKHQPGLIGYGEAANEYDDNVAVFTQAQSIPALVAVPGRVRENKSLMTLLGFANVPRLRMCRTCNLPVS